MSMKNKHVALKNQEFINVNIIDIFLAFLLSRCFPLLL